MVPGHNNVLNALRSDMNLLSQTIKDIANTINNNAESIANIQQQLSYIDGQIQSIATILLLENINQTDEDTIKIKTLKQSLSITHFQNTQRLHFENRSPTTNNSNKRVSDDDDVVEFQPKMLKVADDNHRLLVDNRIEEVLTSARNIDSGNMDAIEQEWKKALQLSSDPATTRPQQTKIFRDVLAPLYELALDAMNNRLQKLKAGDQSTEANVEERSKQTQRLQSLLEDLLEKYTSKKN